jgi:hypothetical protein
MPSSYADSFAPIVHTLIGLDPKSVLDVGPGWGKYGLACREYLPALERLMAVEVPEGRLCTQDTIYDQVYTGDVRLFGNSEFWRRFDLVLLIDVIEHMPLDEGKALLSGIARAGVQALVSTPRVFFEQHVPGNPHEAHLCVWGAGDFAELRLPVLRDASTRDSFIYALDKVRWPASRS